MRLIVRLSIASLMGIVVLIGSVSRTSATSAEGTILRARAIVSGAAGSGISGEVQFFQARQGVPAEVLIIARIEGLTPNSKHGFHLHEIGACVPPGFTAAGGHYDPGPFGNSQPDNNHPYHMGDMPNLKADEYGVARFEHVTSRVTIAPGPLSLFDADGSAVIVHLNEDLGTTGVPGGSGGPRIACGVITLIQ